MCSLSGDYSSSNFNLTIDDCISYCLFARKQSIDLSLYKWQCETNYLQCIKFQFFTSMKKYALSVWISGYDKQVGSGFLKSMLNLETSSSYFPRTVVFLFAC